MSSERTVFAYLLDSPGSKYGCLVHRFYDQEVGEPTKEGFMYFFCSKEEGLDLLDRLYLANCGEFLGAEDMIEKEQVAADISGMDMVYHSFICPRINNRLAPHLLDEAMLSALGVNAVTALEMIEHRNNGQNILAHLS